MARSKVNTYGLLDAWARVMHEDFWRFNQFEGNGVTNLPGCSSGPYIQYERDYMAAAIWQAVAQAAEHLGFYPMPVWVTERLELMPGTDWDDQRLATTYGYVQGFGNRQTQLIHSAKAVSYSDTNSDSVEDKGSITVDAIFPIDETRVFFRVADGAAGAGHILWEIHELETIDNDDGTYTISGHKSQFADPEVWGLEYSSTDFRTKSAGGTEVSGDFVTAVDVYRVYADGTKQADNTAAVTLVASDGTTQPMQARLTNSRFGTFRLAKFTGDDDPDDDTDWIAVDVTYLAGYALENKRMSPTFESVLLRYANTLMPQQPNAFCERVRAMWERDLEVQAREFRDTENPLQYPFTLAAIDLWATLKTFKSKNPGPTQQNGPFFLGV